MLINGEIPSQTDRDVGGGVAVTYDVAADFAVLCANCHRMIHKSDDPSDLNKFRDMVQSNKT
jgi:predicted HNH restriction endonuclease